MNFDLEKVIQQIIETKEFQGLKNFVENNGGHDHELSYDHSIATYERMKNFISGDKISNPEAKRKLYKLLNEKISGVNKKNLLIITALLHDIGKSVYQENGKNINKNITHADGTTISPEHRKIGPLWAGPILERLRLSKEMREYITKIIGLHVGSTAFGKSEDEFVMLVKGLSKTLYVEVLLLMHADLFNHPEYDTRLKERTIRILNSSTFYS